MSEPQFSFTAALGADLAATVNSGPSLPSLNLGDEKAIPVTVISTDTNPQLDLTHDTSAANGGGAGAAGPTAPAGTGTGTGTGMDVEYTSLQHYANTFQRLLDTLEDAPTACKPETMKSILATKTIELTKGLSHFHPRSTTDEAAIRSGTVERRGEKRAVGAKWIDFVLQMSEATNLNEEQALDIVEFCVKQTKPRSPHLDEAIEFYYLERTSVLGCLCAMMRIADNPKHPYREVVYDALIDWDENHNFEQSIYDQYQTACNPKIPTHKRMDDFSASSRWADHCVNEQARLLEIIFLWYYGRKCPYGSVMATCQIIQSTNFGKHQPLYTYLSDRGRRTVEWIGHMCVLIVLNLMNFEELLNVWDDAHAIEWRFKSLPVYAKHPLVNAPKAVAPGLNAEAKHVNSRDNRKLLLESYDAINKQTAKYEQNRDRSIDRSIDRCLEGCCGC